MKRKALGKGLSSLIPTAPPAAPVATVPVESAESRSGVMEIDLDRIRPNRHQPRREFDQAKLEALAKSLKTNGIIQPIAVRSLGNGIYELLAGERRWRAAQHAGFLKIPAVVHEVPDERLLEFALIENLQREDLNPIDEALAYRALLDEFALTQKDIAARVGKRRATIANTLRLLTLAKKVQERVQAGSLSMGHARALASLSSPRQQEELAELIEKKGLSVRQAESLVNRMSKQVAPTVVKPVEGKDPNVLAAEQNLQSLIGTKVRIVQGRKGGRLEIHYYGDEELQRIYNLVYEAAGSKP